MQGINVVCIGGNLARDPEPKGTKSGIPVLNFTVAVTDERRDESGQWQEYANFVDCAMFGNRGKAVGRYLRKGMYVVVTGRLRQDKWQAKDGSNRTKLEVIVDNIRFDGGKNNGGRDDSPAVYDDDVPF